MTFDEMMGRVGVSADDLLDIRQSIVSTLVGLADAGWSPDAARARVLAIHDQQIAQAEEVNPRAAEVLAGQIGRAVEGAVEDFEELRRIAAEPAAPFLDIGP